MTTAFGRSFSSFSKIESLLQNPVGANHRFDAQACNHWLLAVFRPTGADTLCPTKLQFSSGYCCKTEVLQQPLEFLQSHPVKPGAPSVLQEFFTLWRKPPFRESLYYKELRRAFALQHPKSAFPSYIAGYFR
jgi:hypothetical protein